MMAKARIVICWLVAALFLYAGFSKLPDPRQFARSIEHYQLVTHPVSLALALWIPWIECLAGLALLLRKWRLSAGCILLVLLFVFEGILASAYFRGLDIDCGCIGGVGQSVTFAFIRNIVLIVMLATLLGGNKEADVYS